MKYRPSTLILTTNFVGDHQRTIHTKFEANLCSGLREVEKVKRFTMTMMTATIVTLTH